MPRATHVQNNFNSGEWSPLTWGRSDIAKYKNGLELCSNYIPTAQGGLTRRPGTRYVAATKSSGEARLVRFEFSITQAYVLELGDHYARFYTNDGQLQTSGVAAYNGATAYVIGDLVTSAGVTYYCIANTTGNAPPNATYWYAQTGTIYEIPTPYAVTDIWALSFTQSADVLYIAHPLYVPRKLQRFGATNWKLASITFTDGPYLNLNTTTTTLQSNVAGPGAATVTASANLFVASDVGRAIRLKSGTSWGWGTITGYTSATQVTVNWVTAVGLTAVTVWRLGVWGTANGYPGTVTFHQDRLAYAGCTAFPARIDASNTSDYENFAPSETDGTVVDSNAWSFTLNSNTVNLIQWMVSDEFGLLCGTAGGEWVVAPSSAQTAITPTNVNARNTTSYGSSSAAPIRVGKSLLFVQRTKRKLREMAYRFELNTFQAQDISLIGEHLTKGGLKQMAVQLAPQPIIWICRIDGTLVGVSYDKDQDICGWHRHQMGGYSDSGHSVAPLVESVASIPAPSVDRDEVWVIVKRYVNGAAVRYVEVMTKLWEDGDSLEDGVFVDSSAEYSGVATTTISGLTWLIGQTVSVLANGAVHPTCVVDGAGLITLNRSVTKAQVGLGYNSDGKTLRIEAGGADGPAQGKLKRLVSSVMRFFQSVGLNYFSNSTSAYYPQSFRDSSAAMDAAVPLFTGDKRWSVDGTWDMEGQLSWRQSDPLPSNILMLQVQVDTQDGG